jgi:hypothetical protein
LWFGAKRPVTTRRIVRRPLQKSVCRVPWTTYQHSLPGPPRSIRDATDTSGSGEAPDNITIKPASVTKEKLFPGTRNTVSGLNDCHPFGIASGGEVSQILLKNMRTLTNVVCTPHVASRTYESVVRQATCAVKNLILAMNGEKPIAQVNPEVPVKKVV